MSCLLIVSWVIEVEYTLTAIPQLGKKQTSLFAYEGKINSDTETLTEGGRPRQNSKGCKSPTLAKPFLFFFYSTHLL